MGTEHILLGLLDGEDDPAVRVLSTAGVTRERVRAAVVRMMGRGPEAEPAELAFTGPAHDVVDLAWQTAARRGLDRAGTEHLLLALIAEQDGAAARILLELDADLVAIRAALAS